MDSIIVLLSCLIPFILLYIDVKKDIIKREREELRRYYVNNKINKDW